MKAISANVMNGASDHAMECIFMMGADARKTKHAPARG